MKRQLMVVLCVLAAVSLAIVMSCSEDDDDSPVEQSAVGCCLCVMSDTGSTILTDGVEGIGECGMVCSAYGIVSEMDWQAEACPPADDDDSTDDDSGSDDDDAAQEETYTDPDSGLMWEKYSFEYVAGADADTWCDWREYAGHDDWRLPTINELRTLIRNCPALETGGDCAVTNECTDVNECFVEADCMDQCPPPPCRWPDEMGDGVECTNYFHSATTATGEGFPSNAASWSVAFQYGSISTLSYGAAGGVICVRDAD